MVLARHQLAAANGTVAGPRRVARRWSGVVVVRWFVVVASVVGISAGAARVGSVHKAGSNSSVVRRRWSHDEQVRTPSPPSSGVAGRVGA